MWVSAIQQEEAEDAPAIPEEVPEPEVSPTPPEEITFVSFVRVPTNSYGKCGVRDGLLYIPLCRMGCIGDGAMLWFPPDSPINNLVIPYKMDMEWLDSIAYHLNSRVRFADYHAHSFQQNIIRPNIAKIAFDLGGISDKVKTRIEQDLWIFLNNWKSDKHNPEHTFENMVKNDMYLPCRETLLMDVDCEY
jgi:hypothetical protein